MTKKEINNINSGDVNLDDLPKGMRQYVEIKRQYTDAVLLYRMGDFYETFFEDAYLMAKILDITLTGRDCGGVYGRIALAGIPIKSLDTYLEKLVQNGLKVAICEQLEDPKLTKDIVKRGVVRIVTAGTIIESDLLQKNSNNYIAAIFQDKKTDFLGFAYTDISTGEFKITQSSLNMLLSELARIKPTEIIAPSAVQKVLPFQIVPDEKIDLPDEITNYYNCSKVPSSIFEENFAQNNLKTVFKVKSLDSFNIENCKIGLQAAGALVAYIWENMKESFPKFDRIETYELSEYMILDSATRKNLELTETLREKNKFGSLLWAIDRTKTNMGARMLKSWITQPLKNVEEIKQRQDYVQEIIEKNEARLDLMSEFEKISDIQRVSTRLSNGGANPREFLHLKNSLYSLPALFNITASFEFNFFENIIKYDEEMAEFAQIIDRTISDEPPMNLKEGGYIKEGCSADLDYLRGLLVNGEEWLRDFEEKEKEKTGIKFLKVGFNKVFGFFIEVTNSNLDLVPRNYIRKQTLTNAERFITDELKKHEDDVLNAQFKAIALESKIFSEFKEYSKEYVTKLREIAETIARADVLTSLASIAVENDYTRPIIDNSNDFIVKNGRHPVLEKILQLGSYVANDIDIAIDSYEKPSFMILTGPNMAGKSTYMRQNALIVLLAQIGSFVPADYCKIGVVDKIFTRVGASDDLTLGQSTFMVEMTETASILNSATERSFILLDEIGRGTSTYDGVAIAWSVAEFIATKIKARCIFATHYHELNVMTNTYPQIKNFRITITEENGHIEFLRKIVQGGASKSYGIQVAKMAGLPNSVISRSEELMLKMQKRAQNLTGRKKTDITEDELPQLNLF